MCKYQEQPDFRESEKPILDEYSTEHRENAPQTRELDVKVNCKSLQPKAQTIPLVPKTGQKATQATQKRIQCTALGSSRSPAVTAGLQNPALKAGR